MLTYIRRQPEHIAAKLVNDPRANNGIARLALAVAGVAAATVVWQVFTAL